jgi:hypothetical protein
MVAGLLLIAAAAGILHIIQLKRNVARSEETEVFLSPTGDRGIAAVRGFDVTRVWLQHGGVRTLVATLAPGQSVGKVVWSPDGRLAAFESYDGAGHSPLTTTHVRVIDGNSGDVREVTLPPPNERFSTHFEQWAGNETLRIRTTLLEKPDDLYLLVNVRQPASMVQGPGAR